MNHQGFLHRQLHSFIWGPIHSNSSCAGSCLSPMPASGRISESSFLAHLQGFLPAIGLPPCEDCGPRHVLVAWLCPLRRRKGWVGLEAMSPAIGLCAIL